MEGQTEGQRKRDTEQFEMESACKLRVREGKDKDERVETGGCNRDGAGDTDLGAGGDRVWTE